MDITEDEFHLLSLDIVIASSIIIQHVCESRRKRRRFHVRDILTKRRNLGHYSNLVSEMRLTNVEGFTNFHRMTPEMFDSLLHIVGPSLVKNNTTANPITAGERLSLTIR